MKRLFTIPGLFIMLVLFPCVLSAQTNLEEIISDMTLPHEGRPHGVPDNYDWAKAPRPGPETPPEGWDAAIAWGQLYEWIEGNPATNTRVQIRDLELQYLSKSDLEWHVLQVALEVEGASYVEDFAGDVNKPADRRKESDGSWSVTCGDGYNFHFWPKQGRTTFPKDDIKGIYATVRARLIMDDPDGIDDRESARYVMSVGGDWWESLTAVWDNWTTNADMGIGRFRFVTSEWKSFNMISLPADTVRKYPPQFHTEGPVGISKSKEVVNSNLSICPNPLSSNGHLSFEVANPGIVKFTILGLDGKTIQILSDREFSAGKHSLIWDTDYLSNGVYYLKMENNKKVDISKFMVLN